MVSVLTRLYEIIRLESTHEREQNVFAGRNRLTGWQSQTGRCVSGRLTQKLAGKGRLGSDVAGWMKLRQAVTQAAAETDWQ